jgi:tetratricopeptide (TPR) repeat protein
LKLGQIYFQQPDYPNAETQFATLAKDFPDSPHAETALFLAGQAAARTINTGSAERALRYLDELADRNGPLKLHAREQQAAIQSRLGREQEAVALYDLIIEAKQPAPDATLRATAMVGKGDALASLGRSDPRHLETAAKVFEDLARLEANPPAWRHQALYKRARILEQLGRKADAIAVYNEVLDRNLAASDREFFWFYKAGFEAARAYEQDRAWSSAIAIYEKIARLDGPRAEEAKSRAKQLRVENFVWE